MRQKLAHTLENSTTKHCSATWTFLKRPSSSCTKRPLALTLDTTPWSLAGSLILHPPSRPCSNNSKRWIATSLTWSPLNHLLDQDFGQKLLEDVSTMTMDATGVVEPNIAPSAVDKRSKRSLKPKLAKIK